MRGRTSSDPFTQPTSQSVNADANTLESQLKFLKAPRCEVQAIMDGDHGNNIQRILHSLTELRYPTALTLELMQLVLSVAKSLLLIPGTGGCIPSKLVLATAKVQLEVSIATLVRQDLASHTHSGTYKSRIAHFKEYRSLETHSCQGIDVKRVAISQALLRLCFPGPGLVPVVGICRLDTRTFLVEAPVPGSVDLADYLAWNSDVDPRLLLKDIVSAIERLHANGVVLGPVMNQCITVAPTGRAYVCNFDHLRLEDSATPFTPMITSLDVFRRLAPEIVQPFTRERDGLATLTKASDIYSLGCFIFELFTGQKPFPEYTKYPLHLRTLMVAVANGQRFQRLADVDAQQHGLTDSVRAAIEHCCACNPADRPTVAGLLQLPFLQCLVDDRPKD